MLHKNIRKFNLENKYSAAFMVKLKFLIINGEMQIISKLLTPTQTAGLWDSSSSPI